MAVFPTSVPTDSDLYIAINTGVTALTAGIDNVTLTIPVVSTTGFPSVGFITIDSEIIHYTSIGATQFNADQRGADGTAANSHTNGAQVNHFIIAAHHNVHKDEIIAIAQNLSDRIGLGATQLKAQSGSVTAPAYAFAASLDSGIYLTGTGSIRFTSDGVNVISAVASGLEINLDGSASNPSIIFGTDTDTGIYHVAPNELGFSAGGAIQFNIAPGLIESRNGAIYRNGDGTVSLPAYSFVNDTDTGIYRSGANQIALASGGVQTLMTDGTFVYSRFPHLHVDGSVSSPALSFSSDTDTGLYRPTTNELSITVAATEIARFKAAGLEIRAGVIENRDGTLSLPSYSFANDTDTGIYRITTNAIGFVTGGTEAFRISDSAFLVNGRDLFVTRANASAEVAGIVTNNSATSPSYARVQAIHNNGSFSANISLLGYMSGTNLRQMDLEMTGVPVIHGEAQGGVSEMALKINVNNSGQITAMNIPKTGEVQFQAGSVSLPAIAFQSSPDTGIYLTGTGSIRFASDGVNVVSAVATGLEIGINGSVSNPSINWGVDPDTGIYRSGTNNLDLVTGGVLGLRIETPTNGVSIAGVTSGVSAAAGYVGEHLRSTFNNVAVDATDTYKTAASIVLTAGDWDITYFGTAGSTAGNNASIWVTGIGTADGNVAPSVSSQTMKTASSGTLLLSPYSSTERVSITSTTTYYAKIFATYTGTAPTFQGVIRARRIR